MKSAIYLIERVKNIVSALQTIIKEPTANTVPGKNSAVALNNEPNETGPAPKKSARDAAVATLQGAMCVHLLHLQ